MELGQPSVVRSVGGQDRTSAFLSTARDGRSTGEQQQSGMRAEGRVKCEKKGDSCFTKVRMREQFYGGEAEGRDWTGWTGLDYRRDGSSKTNASHCHRTRELCSG